MNPEIIIAAENAALVIAIPLVSLYVRERVANLAREQTDRALADYKHEHDRALAALTALHQKAVQRFGLYTTEQHRVYARLYRRVRIASDQFGWFYRLNLGPDLSKFTLGDLEDYRRANKLRESAVAHIRDCLMTFGCEARDALAELDYKVHRRDAGRSFQCATNYEVLHDLYLSDAVRRAMDTVRPLMAAVSVAVKNDPNDLDERTNGYEKHQELAIAVAGLYRTMRDEMERGGAYDV